LYLRSIEPAARNHDSPRLGTGWTAREQVLPSPARAEDAAFVLRSLIEELGGEATATHLSEALAPELRVEGSWLRDTLGDLDGRGAVTLEDMDGTDVIVRITGTGVDLAYGQLPEHG
jgi:hypothetical protein